MLQCSLHLQDNEDSVLEDATVQWFRSLCESVASEKITIQVEGFPKGVDGCRTIEDTLLSLNAHGKLTENRPIYLDEWRVDRETLFPRLYGLGIVTQNYIEVR